MATEPVSSDPSTTLEQVEKESVEKLKTVEESVIPLNENEGKAKEEEIPTGVPVTPSESVEKAEEKESKSPTVEEVVTPDVEKELKTDEAPTLDVISPEPAEKEEDKLIEPPPAEDIIKSNEVPAVDIPSTDNQEPLNDHVTEVDKSEVSGVLNDSIKDEPEVVSPDVEVKADESPSLDVISPEPDEKEDKPIETPTSEEIAESNVVPAVDISSKDIQELPKDVTEVDEGIKGETEVLPETKDLEKTQEESAEETVVVKPEEPEIKAEIPESETKDFETKVEQAEELPKETEPFDSVTEAVASEEVLVKELLEKTEIPESAIKASEVEEQPEPVITKEPELVKVENVAISAENEEKKAADSVSAPVEEDLSEEKGEAIDEPKKESIEAEPTEKVDVDTAKDKDEKVDISDELKKESVEAEPINKIEVDEAKDVETPSDKVEGIELKSEVEPIGIESSEQDDTTIEDAHIEQRETEVPPTEVTEKIETEDPLKAKEETIETEKIDTEDPIEKKEETVETGNASADVKSEVKQENEVVNEELAVPEAKATEEVASSAPTIQDVGKVPEAEQTSREIQLPVDTEAKKDENDVEVEKKVDVEEPQKSETESKTEEATQAVEPQVVTQEGVEDNAKPDATTEEPVKDGEDAKATEETPKEDAPVKQKNSNNLLSKMKQSLVKAKKAIIKKPQSKTPAT